MKLNKNSWHFKLYQFWWRCEPNKNFCDYFWSLILAVLTLPFFVGWMAYVLYVEDNVYAEHRPEDRISLIKGWYYIINTLMVPTISYLLGVVIGYSIFYWNVTLIILGLVFILIVLWGLWDDFKYSDVNYMIKEKVKSSKSKVCPRIDWDD